MWPCRTDYDADVIFEEDEEEDEAYFFTEQGTPCIRVKDLLRMSEGVLSYLHHSSKDPLI
jgi:hypothetical protein